MIIIMFNRDQKNKCLNIYLCKNNLIFHHRKKEKRQYRKKPIHYLLRSE